MYNNNNNYKTECKQLVRISQRNVLVTERGKERGLRVHMCGCVYSLPSCIVSLIYINI